MSVVDQKKQNSVQKKPDRISAQNFLGEENAGRGHSVISLACEPARKFREQLIRVGIVDANKKSMTYKQTTTGHKTLAYSGVGFPLQGLLEKLRNAVKSSVPVGYQDENGFHFGVKNDEKETKWPTTW